MRKALRDSISENNGIASLRPHDQKIYSVGISTGGSAEMRMALIDPNRHIIATTIDPAGAAFAKDKIKEKKLDKQIEVKIEDVSKPLPYLEGYFDFIYARLVLHYLQKSELESALDELYRILKPGGIFFSVVRSIDCIEAQHGSFDSHTGLTTYSSHGHVFARHFHSEESIQGYLTKACFQVKEICTYKERLCVDFQRSVPSSQIDTLIEVHSIKKFNY